MLDSKKNLISGDLTMYIPNGENYKPDVHWPFKIKHIDDQTLSFHTNDPKTPKDEYLIRSDKTEYGYNGVDKKNNVNFRFSYISDGEFMGIWTEENIEYLVHGFED